MSNTAVEWEGSRQRTVISGLDDEILAMRGAKERILPEIETLRPNWDTPGSIETIEKLENFLNNDLERFINVFNTTVTKLSRVEQLSRAMEDIK